MPTPDVAALETFYAGAVRAEGVDYDLLASRRPMLEAWLAAAKDAPFATWSTDSQLAFWIDAYNALTVRVILDARPLKSILDLDGGHVWTARTFVIGGETLTLDAIENTHVRKLGDGRVHAALSCASKGCPPLPAKPLTGEHVDAELTAAATAWVGANAYAIDGKQVALSKVFDWYAADFVAYNKGDIPNADAKAENALWFLSRYGAGSGALVSGELTPTWAEYDWGLNVAK